MAIATRLDYRYHGLVPVEVSPFWDMSIVRGAFPDRAWDASDLQDDYAAVFGGRLQHGYGTA